MATTNDKTSSKTTAAQKTAQKAAQKTAGLSRVIKSQGAPYQSKATKQVKAAAALKRPGSPGFAPGARPGVITQFGKNVFKDGKLVGSYRTEEAATEAVGEFTAPGVGGRAVNIVGDIKGETFRQLRRVERGAQTGRANIAGAAQAIGSRGFATAVEQKEGEAPQITGAMKQEDIEKMERRAAARPAPIEKSALRRVRPSTIAKMAPLERNFAKEEAARERIVAERGLDVSTASMATKQLLDEAVNLDVYGTALPVFKGAPTISPRAQEAQESAAKVAQAGAAEQQVDLALKAEPPVVRSVITSDVARQFTDDQFRLLEGFQQRSSDTASDAMGGLIETDSDILAAQQAGEDATALLEEKKEFYADVYNRTLEEIKQSYDSKEEGFQSAARQEMAQNTAMLARMGALGTTTAGMQYLGDIERDNQAKMLTFAAEEAAAIQKAYEAYQSADFELAEKMINVAEGTRKEIRDIRSSALEQKIKVKQLQQLEVEDATKTLDNIVKAGMGEEDLPPGYLDYLDEKQGMPYGTSAGLMRVAEQEKEIAAAASEQEAYTKSLDQATKLVNILQDLPFGQTISIGGTEYQSLNQGEITTSTETGPDGTYLIEYNRDTNEKTVTKLFDADNRKYTDITSNEGAIIRSYEDGTQRMVFDPRQPNGGHAKGGLIELFPQGSVTPFTRPNDPNKDRASECGAVVNDWTNLGLGDSFASKMSKMDPNITADSAEPGDVFVQSYGSTGHTGVINGKYVNDNGEIVFIVSESNWKKMPGTGGKVGMITHDREVKASEMAGFARPGFAQDFYNFGTDAPNLEGLTFGKEPTEKEKEIAELASAPRQPGSYVSATGKPAELSAGQVDNLSGLENTLSLIPEIEALNKKVATGIVGKTGQVLKLGFKSEERLSLDAKLNLLKAEFQKAISGATVSEEEQKRLSKFLPKLGDTDKEIRVKLQNLKVEMERKQESLKKTLNIYKVIQVKDNATGQIGTIPENEFDPSLYTKL